MSNANKEKKKIFRRKHAGKPKEEQELQMFWFIATISSVYIISWFFPGMLFFTYVGYLFYPRFLEVPNFLSLFTNPLNLLTLILFPIIIILCYILHLFFASLVVRFWWNLTEKKSPSKDGNIPRSVRSKASKFYHVRSFIVKYPKNAIIKGIFPWLYNKLFNFIGSVEIGKGTTIEEQVVADRGIKIGENCYIGPNSSITSHLVEGIFGNICYFKATIGDNVTLSADTHIGPGNKIGDNSYIFPWGVTQKFTTNKGDNYYFGMPIRKIFSRKIKKFLQITDEDLKKAEELTEKNRKKQLQKQKR
ncbi:MAG: hypothetical protein KGD63_12225 [Candidatus Lokiarchaeota archaeon]|nr:hypothetical protein [Candidatus Lokiarchaeota archaeon]